MEKDQGAYITNMKRDLLCLMLAYPEYIKDLDIKEDGSVYLVLNSGKKLLYDDKKPKSAAYKFSAPDLNDMLEQIYPLTPVKSVLEENFDPGRCRIYELLNEVYGSSRKSIEAKLVNVNFGYGTLRFNSSNKAAESFKAAMMEIGNLAGKNSLVMSNAFPCSGTYNYRLIAGTDKLSPHSYGIAVDLSVKKNDYWKWCNREAGDKRLSAYPPEIAEIFEKNNFIWGGKWSHFDIMHFEYRPEIILKARYFKDSTEDNKLWYIGAPDGDAVVKSYIEKIDSEIK